MHRWSAREREGRWGVGFRCVGRRRVRWVLVAAVVLIVNVVVSMSAGVAAWWHRTTNPYRYDASSTLARVLRARVRFADADVHAVMWFVAGVVVFALCATLRHRLVAVTVLFVSSIIVEIAQMNSPTRTPQVGDVVGSALGLAAALGAVSLLALRSTSARMRTP